MANNARKGLSNAINKVYDVINSDMDMQPTIQPVMDLSSIESGIGVIDGLLNDNRKIGVAANIDAIRTMSASNQNGGIYDVVSAINKLRKDLSGKESNTYSINGITYDDGSTVSEAIKSLVRAAKVERRT